jgi:hypothetical protein
VNATWRAWREAFFDLTAGRPHLPSVATTGPPPMTSEPAIMGADESDRQA